MTTTMLFVKFFWIVTARACYRALVTGFLSIAQMKNWSCKVVNLATIVQRKDERDKKLRKVVVTANPNVEPPSREYPPLPPH